MARLHTGNIALRRFPWGPRNPFRPVLVPVRVLRLLMTILVTTTRLPQKCSTSSE